MEPIEQKILAVLAIGAIMTTSPHIAAALFGGVLIAIAIMAMAIAPHI